MSAAGATCPEPGRLAAAAAGEDPTALAHADGCVSCRRALADQAAVRGLAAELRGDVVPARRRAQLGALVLAGAEQIDAVPELEAELDLIETEAEVAPTPITLRPSRRRRWSTGLGLALGGVAAAAAATWWWSTGAAGPTPSAPGRAGQVGVGPRPDEVQPPGAGQVSAPAPARPTITHLDGGAIALVREVDRDVVRVADGRLQVDTTAPGTTPVALVAHNAQLVARSARLEAATRAGVLASVAVFAGSVEITSAGGAVVVSAGELWRADEAAGPTQTATSTGPGRPRPRPEAGTPGRGRAAVAAPTPTPPAGAPDAAGFDQAWQRLRAGEFAAAARLFDAVTDRALADEAAYWAAVAWARAGDAGAGRDRLTQFLARYPRSPRVGAAHLALGKMLLGSDPTAARHHLEAALTDDDPRVREAAGRALAPPP